MKKLKFNSDKSVEKIFVGREIQKEKKGNQISDQGLIKKNNKHLKDIIIHKKIFKKFLKKFQ